VTEIPAKLEAAMDHSVLLIVGLCLLGLLTIR
jgi:hypothetical protein